MTSQKIYPTGLDLHDRSGSEFDHEKDLFLGERDADAKEVVVHDNEAKNLVPS
jgi:hypothetical protein